MAIIEFHISFHPVVSYIPSSVKGTYIRIDHAYIRPQNTFQQISNFLSDCHVNAVWNQQGAFRNETACHRRNNGSKIQRNILKLETLE